MVSMSGGWLGIWGRSGLTRCIHIVFLACRLFLSSFRLSLGLRAPSMRWSRESIPISFHPCYGLRVMVDYDMVRY